MVAKLVTIDGPSGVGKGTASRGVANLLGWHWLDSGALYRLVAYCALTQKVALSDESALAAIADNLAVEFDSNSEHDQPPIYLAGQDVALEIRSQDCGQAASVIAAHPAVRQALLERQRRFATPQGLVADGRDMGTVIFPDAPVKIFLTASAQVRAKRRYNQLLAQGSDVNIADLEREITARDARDSAREVAPLEPASDALVIDTSFKSIASVRQAIIDLAIARGLC